MTKFTSLKNLLSNISEKTNCSNFLRELSSCIPFQGVSFVEVPEALPAKVKSKYTFTKERELKGVEFYLCNSVRRKLKDTIWTPENFLIDPKTLDNQEFINKYRIKLISRIPIFLDYNTVAGIIYFVHDEEEIGEDNCELFILLNSIGAIFSRIYFREFRCELRGAYAEVDQLKKMMNSNHYLISSVIHDISNPLTVIYLEAQKIIMNREKNLDKGLSNIEGSIDHIYKIIDSTKKFFSKHKGKEDLQTLSVGDVVEFITLEYGSQMSQKKLSLESDGLDLEFIAFKSTFFKTVISSLISNSIRFSPAGSTIKFYGRAFGGGVDITIEDRAGGFPQEVLENLKGSFKSKPRPSTSGEVGSGMGLILAKSYLEIMNGSLSIESFEEGSRVTLKMAK